MLRNKKGEVAPETAAKIIFAALGLALAVCFMAIGVTYFKVATTNAELVRQIEVAGDYSGYEATRNHLLETVELDPEHCASSIAAQPITGTKKIQYGSEFSVTLTYTKHYKIGNDSNKWFYIDWKIPVKSTLSGRSEQYWK